MQHLDEGLIHAWLDGALPPEDAAAVESHAAACPECAALVAEARGLLAGASRIVAALDVVPGGVIPQKKPADGSLWRALRFTPARAAIAATLLVGVASMFTARRQSTTVTSSPIPAPAATSQSAPAAVVPPSAPVVRENTAANRPSADQAQRPTTPLRREPAVAQKAADTLGGVGSAAQAVTAPAAPPAAPAAAPLAEMRAGASAAGVRAGAARAFNAAAAVRDAEPLRCFRVAADSLIEALGIPSVLVLQRDSTGALIVRGATPGLKIDSVLVGATWRELPANTTVVSIPGRSGQPAIQLTFAADGTRGRMQAGTRTADVGIERTACRP